jgi:hypothetical protein
MKDRAFQRVEEIMDAITLTWNGVTLEQLQSVFLNWTGHLEWVTANRGGYYIAWHENIYWSLLGTDIAGGCKNCLHTLYMASYFE